MFRAFGHTFAVVSYKSSPPDFIRKESRQALEFCKQRALLCSCMSMAGDVRSVQLPLR